MKCAIENIVGGDVNYCTLQATDQRGGCRVVLRKREYSCKLFVVSEEFSTQRKLSDTYTHMNNFTLGTINLLKSTADWTIS